MVYLTFLDGQSAKFYEVTVDGVDVIIRYGRVGTQGQTSRSTYDSAAAAQSAADKKIAEKLKKGYVRSPNITPTVETPAASSSAVVNAPDVATPRRLQTVETFLMRFNVTNELRIPVVRSLSSLRVVTHFWEPTFTINLRIGKDIAYHFNPRMYQREIVQNTCIAGTWGLEERLPIPQDLLSRRQFGLEIKIENDVVVKLNESLLCRYAHRLPPEQIDAVEIVYNQSNLRLDMVQVFEHVEAPETGVTSVQTNVAGRSQPATGFNQDDEEVGEESLMTETTESDAIPESNFVPQFLRDLPERFQPLRAVLESQLEPYIKIRATEADDDPPALWESKIGGEPYLPKGYEYPRDRFTGEIMPLLIQINCADVPKLAGFDFPEQGILQVYLGYCASQSELSPEQCRVLYFPEFSENEDDLVTDFSLIDYSETLQEYMDAAVYRLEFAPERTLFQISRFGERVEAPEELIDLYEEFKDEYDIPEIGDKLGSLLGSPDFDTECVIEGVPGKVFLELRETMPNGEYLLFLIEDEDLKRRDFSKVHVGIVFY